MLSTLLDKTTQDLREAHEMADDAQRGAVTMFNEQKRYELSIQRLQSDVHQARTASDKVRTEAVNLRVFKSYVMNVSTDIDYMMMQ